MGKFRLSTMAVVAVAVVPMLTTQASAATTTYTVKAGSAPAGTTVPFTLTSQGSAPQVKFHDADTNQNFPTCSAVTWPGNLRTGTDQAPFAAITGSRTSWNDCPGPVNLKFTMTGQGAWQLSADAYSMGVTQVNLSSVLIHVVDGTVCKFDISGSSVATYTNSTGLLVFTGMANTFKISGVSGCLNIVREGDSANLTAGFKLTANTASQNPVLITSP